MSLKRKAQKVRKAGTGDDTILAHIEPWEAKLLHDITDGVAIEESTGLPKFEDPDGNEPADSVAGEQSDAQAAENDAQATGQSDNENVQANLDIAAEIAAAAQAAEEARIAAEKQREIEISLKNALPKELLGEVPYGKPKSLFDQFMDFFSPPPPPQKSKEEVAVPPGQVPTTNVGVHPVDVIGQRAFDVPSFDGGQTQVPVDERGQPIGQPDLGIPEGPVDNRGYLEHVVDFVKNNPRTLAVSPIMGSLLGGLVNQSPEAMAALGLDMGGVAGHTVDEFGNPVTLSSLTDLGYTPSAFGYNGPPTAPTTPTGPTSFDEGDGDNYSDLMRFIGDPTYGNIPTFNEADANAALMDAILGINTLVDERGLTGLGYAQGGRDRAIDVFNQFKAGDAYSDLLNFNIGQEFGNTALIDKRTELVGEGTSAINTAFPGDAFLSLDDSIIDSIVTERTNQNSGQIANQQARGNFSDTGAAEANKVLQGQIPDVRSSVEDAGRAVLGGYRSDIGDIRDEAINFNANFDLGDTLFDVTPFSNARQSLIDDKATAFRDDVVRQIGSDPLFDVNTALSAGGRTQGLVSGDTNQSALDDIAAKQAASRTPRDRRGLGSRGSGAF